MTVRRSDDGYNPAPAPVIDAIASQVIPGTGTLLDNVAGEGGAATALAQAWGLSPTFVELDPARAALCAARRSGPVLVGSAEDVVLDTAPSVWYFNPPWDPGDPEGYLESQLFAASRSYALGPATLAVIVLPVRALEQPEFFGEVVRQLERVAMRAFPEPYHSAFEQFVTFGYGRTQLRYDAAPAARAAEVPPLVSGELGYAIPPWDGRPLGARIVRRRPAASR